MTSRTSTIVLEVNDRFSAALNNFSAGVQKGTDALKNMSGAAGPAATVTDNAGRKIEDMGRKSEVMGDKLTRAFGGSSRAVNVFGNAIAGAAGVTGPLGYAIDVLIDGGTKAALMFGGLTAAVMLVGEAFKFYNDWLNKSAAAELKAAEQRAMVGKNMTAIFAAQNTKTELAAVNAAIEETTRNIVAARAALEGQGPTSLFAVDPEIVNRLVASLDRLVQRRNDLTSEGYISPEQLGGLLEFTNATDKAVTSTANLAAAIRGVRVQQAAAAYSEMVGGLLEFTNDTDAGVSKFEATSRTRGPTQKNTEAGGSGGGILRQFQNDALSIYKRLTTDSELTAKEIQRSFTDAFAGIIEAQAQLNNNSSVSLIGLQQSFSEVFANLSQDTVAKLLTIMDAGGEMAQSLISQLYQIAAAGGTAADMANALTDAINRVPTNKVINIRYNVSGGGPRYGQRNPQATNWGDEWWFDLGGEGYAVQQDWFNRYGNYDIANEEWKKAHRAELEAQGQSGPTTPEPKAFGMHGVVTGPKLMMVGERGPERVDITPGTGARMGGGGGGGVAVTINSLVPPNEFEVQQLAMRLKRYMRT